MPWASPFGLPPGRPPRHYPIPYPRPHTIVSHDARPSNARLRGAAHTNTVDGSGHKYIKYILIGLKKDEKVCLLRPIAWRKGNKSIEQGLNLSRS